MINENSLFNAMIDAMKTHHGMVSSIKWSNGTTFCFLYDGQWFPIRAVINHANGLQGQSSNDTTDQCKTKLKNLLAPLKPLIKQIPMTANQLANASYADQIEGRKRIWEAINSPIDKKRMLIQGNA
jgi:hypothetical protein